MKKYNAFEIKLFMAILMVLDHIPHIPGLISPMWQGVFHALTRCVSVWFAYMAVEGFIHTHSRFRYNVRLFLWGGVMAAGNALIGVLFSSKDIQVHNNIFLTLAFGVLMLNLFFAPLPKSQNWSKTKQVLLKIGRILGGLGAIVLAVMFGEGAHVVIPFMLITYLCRNRIKLRNILYLLWSALLLVLAYQPYPDLADTIVMFLYNCDGLFITVLPFLYLYNGERGSNTKFSKYIFYVFYQLHLWLIACIAYAVS